MPFILMSEQEDPQIDELLPENEGGQTEVTANQYVVSFWGNENVLELDTGDGCTKYCEDTKTTELYTLKGCLLYELHLNVKLQ